MKQSNKKHILMRYLLVVAIMLAFSAAIVWDLFKTTAVYAGDWNRKADSISQDSTIIVPERGKILADNGTVLAANMKYYTVRIDWGCEGIKDDTLKKYLPALCDSLAEFDNEQHRSPEQWKQEIMQAKDDAVRYYRLFKRLSHNEVERIKTFPFLNKGRRQTGLYTEPLITRSKPYGAMAARSIGNVGEVVDSTWNRRLGKWVKTTHGIHGSSGLEMALDSLLYGTDGQAITIQLTNGISNWPKVAAVPGYDVTTTINVQLQDIVEDELDNMLRQSGARWGTAVLMETATGEIKAISNLEWNEAAGDYIEGRNNAVLGFEPGSVMKPISMMVALEDGIISNIDQSIETGTVWNYCGRPIKDPHGGPALSPRQIIETSSNIGMSKIIVRKYGNNPDGFRQRLQQLGFFDAYHTGIGGETEPVFQKLKNDNGGRVALTRMAFGYTTLIPPMHILGMYNAIANDGRYVCPHLVKKLAREGLPDSIVPLRYIRQQVCSPENAAKLRQMMHDVVWGQHGTARNWVQSDTVEIAGKTGTAYTINDNGQYGSTRRLAFCGFFPYKHPKYTCVVLMLGADRGAAASSGVVLKNIALKMYARGLLDNQSDYRATTPQQQQAAQEAPTVFASYNPQRGKALRQGLGLQRTRVFQTPTGGGKDTMPNVTGLNVRDAVNRLERLGMSVRLSGTGYVCRQSVAPGSRITQGQPVYLALAQ